LTIEVNSGRDSSDHVLTFFAFFIELGVLCAILSAKTDKKIRFSILTGVCMGLAYLCKWHPALIILPIWLVAHANFKDILRGIIPLSITAVFVALPWQIYLFQHYPLETKWMYQAIFQPISEAIQGHEGGWWYYLNEARITFGELIYLPMLWFAVVFFKKYKKQNIRILGVWLFLPILIYSLMATKRQAYLIENGAALFILTALFLRCVSVYKSKTRFSPKIIQFCIVLLVVLPIRYTIERVKPFDKKEQETAEQRTIKDWKNQLPNDGKAVVFNTTHYIETMFYHNIAAAYQQLPTNDQINDLILRGYKIFIVNGKNIPLEVRNRKDIHFL
jgi:4-amino-4-deoxy-L-arabinose transferase-like glycosyltransferase